MNNSNHNTISVIPMIQRNIGRDNLLLAIFLSWVVGWISPAHAEDLRNNDKRASDSIQIVTSALGLEEWTKYSANPRAVGYGWPNALGIEASYYDLGVSKFSKHRLLENNTAEDVGRRVDVKLAMDVSTSIAPGTRVYSRVGVYLWDVDINYNRSTREFNSSRDGNSGLMGVGAALSVKDARVSLEVEQLALGATTDSRDAQRILMHVTSKF